MSSHNNIRQNKTCQNCGAFVQNKYCSHCGQQNSESRQSFHHLFTHFASDFLHYDSSFWRTARHLFFSPGKLSIEYMNGKRKSYANPFSLYIFISFLTFFIPTLIPDTSSDTDKDWKGIYQEVNDNESIKPKSKLSEDGYELNEKYGKVYTAKELEDKHRLMPEEDKIGVIKYHFHLILLNILQSEEKDESSKFEKAVNLFLHNLSKVLFIYMPIFAFWLWLFHNKKKRYYFDSGIFTLHFFSFWLLLITLLVVIINILNYFHVGFLSGPLIFASLLYVTFYFFRANRNFYDEGRFISNLKAMIIMAINTFFIFIISIFYALWTIFVVFH